MPKGLRSTKQLSKISINSIDFGIQQQSSPIQENPFYRVNTAMLKYQETRRTKNKPIQYEKLQKCLQQKLKNKYYNAQKQRDDVLMLQKCKGYFHIRRNKKIKNSPNICKKENQQKSNKSYVDVIKNVMNECWNSKLQFSETKNKMKVFMFYCQMMDRRLQKMSENIVKKDKIY